ncbi:hypothetical protein [Lysinibacillus sp. RC79]|uniref:hypothetical protein n=1 Tax=Lysinibacillus sp. RC79 TaxID=3156296 RepID=UPI003516DA0E
MKSISGTISLCFSFVLFIYITGLKMEFSSKYDSDLFFFPITLLIISLIFFGLEIKKADNSKK